MNDTDRCVEPLKQAAANGGATWYAAAKVQEADRGE